MKDNKDHLSKYHLSNAFREHQKVMILGLCGYTGSGCSTAAKLLEAGIKNWKLPEQGNSVSEKSDEIVKRIIYSYAMHPDNIDKYTFMQIKVSGILVGQLMTWSNTKYWKKVEKYMQDCLYVGDTEIEEVKKNLKDIGKSTWEFSCESFKKKDFKILCKNAKGNKSIKHKNGKNGESNKVKFKIGQLNNHFNKYCSKRARFSSKKDDYTDSELSLLACYAFRVLPIISNKFLEKTRSIIGRSQTKLLLQEVGNLARQHQICNSSQDCNKQNHLVLAIDTYISLAIKQDRRLLSSGPKESMTLEIRFSRIKIKEDQKGSKKDKNGSIRDIKKEEYFWKYRGGNTALVVNSLKNSFEVKYLRERHSNFYLISLNAAEKTRSQRLQSEFGDSSTGKHYSPGEVNLINDLESMTVLKLRFNDFNADRKQRNLKWSRLYPDQTKTANKVLRYAKKNKAILPFIGQSIDQCIENADIFIDTTNSAPVNYFDLKWSLLRYITLMLNPGVLQPTNIERCMQIAYAAKANSGCISRQVGAAVTDKDFNIRAVGWNDPPAGVVACNYRDQTDMINGWNDFMFSDLEKAEVANYADEKTAEQLSDSLAGNRCIFCFKDMYNKKNGGNNQVHTRALHGEENAFLNLINGGNVDISEGNLFTTSGSCELCTKKAYQLGISKIVYIEAYKGISESHVAGAGFEEHRPVFELFTGAIGRAYTQLYTPIIPRKDEMDIRAVHNMS